MIKFKKLLPIFIIIIFLSNCGYTPKYAINKNVNFIIDVVELTGDREFNNYLKSKLSRYSDKTDSEKIVYKLNLKTEFKKNIKSKDAAGLANKYELVVSVDALIKSNLMETKKLVFKEKFVMKKIEDSFEEKNYEKIIKENFSETIKEKIIFYLYKL